MPEVHIGLNHILAATPRPFVPCNNPACRDCDPLRDNLREQAIAEARIQLRKRRRRAIAGI